jgi:hypothetical protein
MIIDFLSKITFSEVHARKKKVQDCNIASKRAHSVTVPCYIYVFFLNSELLFGGWHVAIIARRGEWYLSGDYSEYNYLFDKIRRWINVGVFPEFIPEWCEAFCHLYSVPARGLMTKRGKFFAQCTVDAYKNLKGIELNS